MHNRYEAAEKDPMFFDTAESVMEFDNWRVIENQFPYDAIAERHDLLIPKLMASFFSELSAEEVGEVLKLVGGDGRLAEYDSVVWNLPHQQSQPHWIHFHLIKYQVCKPRQKKEKASEETGGK